MRITWHGHSCFHLEWSEVSVLTDPFDETVGYQLPQIKADIVTVSHEHHDHNHTTCLPGQPVILPAFEVSNPPVAAEAGLIINGLASYHDEVQGQKRGPNTIFRFDCQGISIAHLGDLGHLLTPQLIAGLKGVDILLVPVGGIYTIDGCQAAQIVQQLRPHLTIPMHFQTDSLKFELDEVHKFTQHFSAVHFSSEAYINVNVDDLTSAEPSIRVLKYLS